MKKLNELIRQSGNIYSIPSHEFIDCLREYFKGIDNIDMGFVPTEIMKVINTKESTSMLFIVKINEKGTPDKIVMLMFEENDFYCKIYPSFQSVPSYSLKNKWTKEDEFLSVVEEIYMFFDEEETGILFGEGQFILNVLNDSPHREFRRLMHYLKSCDFSGLEVA